MSFEVAVRHQAWHQDCNIKRCNNMYLTGTANLWNLTICTWLYVVYKYVYS